MTVQSTVNKITHLVSDIGQTEYIYDFRVDEADHMIVYLNDVEQSPGDYIVNDLGSLTGGTITISFTTALDDQLLILREMPLTQLLDYITYGKFPSATHEKGLDYGVMIDQQLQEAYSRAMRFPVYEDVDPLLPSPEYNYVLVWNEAENALVNKRYADVGGEVLIYEDHKPDGKHIVYTSTTALRASTLTPFSGQKISITGIESGNFTWNAASTATDGALNVKITAIPAGRFERDDQIEYMLSYWNGDLASAVAEIGSTACTLHINTQPDDLLVDLDLSSTNIVLDWEIGNILGGAGDLIGIQEVMPDWFTINVDPGTTDMGAALRLAENALTTGGVISLTGDIYGASTSVDSKVLDISKPNVTIKGLTHASVIKYTGAAQIDYLVYVGSGATSNTVFRNVQLLGGEFLLGKCKWVLYATNWNRGCDLDNVIIREGLGLVNLQQCVYGNISHAQFIQTVPDPETQGWSKADWDEVYGSGVAPVYFGGAGGNFKIGHLSIGKIGSETHTGVNGNALVRFDVSGQVDSLSLETSGVTYTILDTYTCKSDYGLYTEDVFVALDDFYSEALGADVAAVYSRGRGGMVFNSPFIFDFRGSAASSLFFCDSTHDITVNDGEFYQIDSERMSRVSGFAGGVSGNVVYSSTITATGKRYTDPTINSEPFNLYDTYDCINKEGLFDVGLPFRPRMTNFPEKVTGLVATNNSDVNGEYIQLTAGIYEDDRANLRSLKVPTETDRSILVVFRLRPQTVSRYYRLYVGTGGNLYLGSQAGDWTEDTGNWLAEFQTDGGGLISGLAGNPRLTMRGLYLNDLAIVSLVVAPTAGRWGVGERTQNTNPAVGSPKGWLCTVTGVPGTWVSEGNL